MVLGHLSFHCALLLKRITWDIFNNIFVYLYDHFPILSSYFPLFTLFLLSESLCMVTTSAIENWYSLSPIQSLELIEFQASFHFGDP